MRLAGRSEAIDHAIGRESVGPWLIDVVESYGKKYIDPTLAGDADAAGWLALSLHNYQRAEVAVAMYRCRIGSDAVRELLEMALTQTQHGHAISRLVPRRDRLAAMLRYAKFVIPDHLPELVTIYRGGDRTPDKAVTGLSWTTDLNVALKFADGGIVLKAAVPKSEIVFFYDGRQEAEVITAGVVSDYTVTTIEPTDLAAIAVRSSLP